MHQQLSVAQLIRSLCRTYRVTSVCVYRDGLRCPVTPGVTSQVQESDTGQYPAASLHGEVKQKKLVMETERSSGWEST